jgi:predicted GNAT family acetyltransferase
LHDGTTGQIEEVATLPRFRGRGLASAVVSRALAESLARDTLTVVLAERAGWPREWYGRIGFETVAAMHEFLLLPGSRR